MFSKTGSKTRRKHYAALLGGNQFKRSKLIDWSLMVLIALNILAIILDSVASLRAQYHALFFGFEIFSVFVFTIEYVARIWVAPDVMLGRNVKGRGDLSLRLRYMLTPIALIDLLSILPFYLGFLIPVFDLRFLRAMRMLRILKLTRYSKSMALLLDVLVEERKSFLAAFFILVMMTVIASCGIYIFEHEIQPEAFGSIPMSMYWSLVTLTTVGYGDVIPVTAGGRIFASLITIVGVGIAALPAGIIASSFSDAFKRRQRRYQEALTQAMADGHIDEDEKKNLEKILQNKNI